MSSLHNKHVLLGISGGIAAYKSAELTRLLVKAGAQVQVVMTHGAKAFITPLTLQALSGQRVHEQLLDSDAEAGMGHIELARWADLVLIAPATADIIARIAGGRADDLLTTLCLATDAPVYLAPAMNQAMWRHPATQHNIARLMAFEGRSYHLLGPQEGGQACGDVGPGRMSEPEQILAELSAPCSACGLLADKQVLLTAGPTVEAIDPVRYISNHSSGKMGFALAEAAVAQGAQVTLVHGPVNLTVPDGVFAVPVVSAEQMYAEVMKYIALQDVFIACAAVADYRAVSVPEHKIKKEADELVIRLAKNPDILAAVGALPNKPYTVGFAAETQAVTTYARDKLTRKNADLIVANNVAEPGIGFNQEDNEVTLLGAGYEKPLPRTSKIQLAKTLVQIISERMGLAKPGAGKLS